MKKVHLRSKRAKHKCRLCKGNICIHEKNESKEGKIIKIPNIAEQSMDILEQLLKDKEGTPEEILKLGTSGELFQLGMDPICITAAMGHTEGMRRFLRAGTDPNVKCTSDGSTPLMLAARNRHFDVVEILLEHGADVSLQNSEGNNSLMLAVKTGDAKLVNAIWPYKEDIDINHANSIGNTALHLAAERTWETCVQFLLANGSAPNQQNAAGWTPLIISAMKGDMKTAERLLNAGGNLLLEDHAGYTAICWAHNGEREDMVKYLLSRMSEHEKDHFVKNRIERLRNPVEESEFESMFNDVFLPLFQHLSKVEEYREILVRVKLVPNVLSVVQRWTKNQDVVIGACNIVCSCMHQYSMQIDERFVQQFIRSRGPEFCIKVLRLFSENNKKDTETLVYCFFPLVCINETPEGKDWIEKNCVKVAQYVSLKDQLQLIKYPDETLKMKTRILWDKFWNEFADMQQCKRDQKMKELLEDEERERAKREKKREKKKQKRQRQQVLKSAQGDTHNDTETSVPECGVPFQDQIQPGEAENDPDKLFSDLYITSTKKDEIKIEQTIAFKDIKGNDQYISMNSNGDVIATDSGMLLHVFQNDDFFTQGKPCPERWTKVVGKKSQSKPSGTSSDSQVSDNGQKTKPKKQATKTATEHKVQEQKSTKKGSKRWADIIKSAVSLSPNVKFVAPKKKVEPEILVAFDDKDEFPCLGATVSKTKVQSSQDLRMIKPDASRSESVVSSTEYLDSDDLGVSCNQDANEEGIPVWLSTTSGRIACDEMSDIYWENTEMFEKEVRLKMNGNSLRNGSDCMEIKEAKASNSHDLEIYIDRHQIDEYENLVQFPDSKIKWIQNMLQAYTDKPEEDRGVGNHNQRRDDVSSQPTTTIPNVCACTTNEKEGSICEANATPQRKAVHPVSTSTAQHEIKNRTPNSQDCAMQLTYNQSKHHYDKTLENEINKNIQNSQDATGKDPSYPLTLRTVADCLINSSQQQQTSQSRNERYSGNDHPRGSGKAGAVREGIDISPSICKKTNFDPQTTTQDQQGICEMPSAIDEMEKAAVEARNTFLAEHSNAFRNNCDDRKAKEHLSVVEGQENPKVENTCGISLSLINDISPHLRQQENPLEPVSQESVKTSDLNSSKVSVHQFHIKEGPSLSYTAKEIRNPFEIQTPHGQGSNLQTEATESCDMRIEGLNAQRCKEISPYCDKLRRHTRCEDKGDQVHASSVPESDPPNQDKECAVQSHDDSVEIHSDIPQFPQKQTSYTETRNQALNTGIKPLTNTVNDVLFEKKCHVQSNDRSKHGPEGRTLHKEEKSMESTENTDLKFKNDLKNISAKLRQKLPSECQSKPIVQNAERQRVAIIQPIGVNRKDVAAAGKMTESHFAVPLVNQGIENCGTGQDRLGIRITGSQPTTKQNGSSSFQTSLGQVITDSQMRNSMFQSKTGTDKVSSMANSPADFNQISVGRMGSEPGKTTLSKSQDAICHMTSNNNSGGFPMDTQNSNQTNEYMFQGNCPLGESILRNALNIKHPVEEVGFLDTMSNGHTMDKTAKSADEMNQFPGFHDDLKRNETADELNKYKLELIQYIQLQKYFQQFCQNAAMSSSNYSHDTQYYACAMGLSKESVASITGEGSAKYNRMHEDSQMRHTMAKSDLNYHPASNKLWRDHENLEHDFVSELQNKISQIQLPSNSACAHSASPLLDNAHRSALLPGPAFDGNHYMPNALLAQNQSFFSDSYFSERNLTRQEKVPVHFHPPLAEKKTEVRAWKRRSVRWRDKLMQIYRLPLWMLKRTGDIIFPADNRDRYRIQYSDQSAVLGFLPDGSEVAVISIDLNQRPLPIDFLQTLISPHFEHYFLAKYKAYAIEGSVCYLALELFEYTLAEFIQDPNNDHVTDVYSTNKSVWQFLKGLAALHENCGIPHGNLMPSNIVIDVEGKLQLSEYAFPRRKFYGQSLHCLQSVTEDRACWTPTEVMTEIEPYSIKSDIQVAGMIMYYILSEGKHVYGDTSLEITVSIQQNWCKISDLTEEITDICTSMLVLPSSDRQDICDIMKHPYFWGDEKRLRFVLIAGSDVLRDLKVGVPTTGSGGNTMIDILNAGECGTSFLNWTSVVDAPIMKEMRSFRQYKNTLVELVLFVYNCCLHFDKLPQYPRDLLDEPCRYFLTKFPRLFMSVYRAIKASERIEKICYKPFF